MPMVKVERFSTVPFETDKILYQTITEWSDEELRGFLQTIGANRIDRGGDEPEVWESDFPPFRVHILRETWPHDSQ